MLDLNDLYFFVQVVEKKGFSAASRALKVPKSSISRRIVGLEARLGVRLIQRTSRSFVVTEVGEELYQHARAMLVEAEAAERVVTRRLAEPSGTVRITCSVGIAQFALSELLPKFLTAYPRVTLIQHASGRIVDLVAEGFDFGIRAHAEPLASSSLIQRPLARIPWYLVAGRAYLQRAGAPRGPADLWRHPGLHLSISPDVDAGWDLRRNEERVAVPFTPRVHSDDIVTLKAAAQAGLGIVALPWFVCRRDLREGSLVRVLPDWIARESAATLLMPSSRGVLPAVRALVDFLAAEFPRVAGE